MRQQLARRSIVAAFYKIAALFIALCGLQATTQAQIPGQNIELPAPHEKIQDRFRYDPFRERGKFDLTPRRAWKMVDGTTIEGILVRWSKEPMSFICRMVIRYCACHDDNLIRLTAQKSTS